MSSHQRQESTAMQVRVESKHPGCIPEIGQVGNGIRSPAMAYPRPQVKLEHQE